MPRLNDLQRRAEAHFGRDDVSKFPPVSYHFPSERVIGVPQRYLVNIPKCSLLDEGPLFEVDELPWDQPFFETILCDNIARAFFRQVRGEWGLDYVNAMKAIGEDAGDKTDLINDAIVQHVKERITRERRNQWGLYVVNEKIPLAWQSIEGMDAYRAIGILLMDRPLGKVAMVDHAYTKGEQVSVLLYPTHPKYESKAKKFIVR